MITVIMPVYNVAEILLRKSIESVLRQDRANLELLLIDDGSTDKSGIICDEYAEKDKRIKVYHTENQGVSAARNLGLDNASGDYVFFVDADDYIAPNCLSKMYTALNESSSDVVLCAAIHVEENLAYTNAVKHSDNKIVLNQKEAVESLCYMSQPYEGYEIGAVWGTLYKREILFSARFNVNMVIGEDFEYKFRIFQNIQKVVCLEDKLYYYLIRSQSAMRNGFDPRKVRSVEELHKNMESTEINRVYYEDYRSRAINIAIVILFMIPLSVDCLAYRAFIENFIKEHRLAVIKNKKTRNKVKLALLTSYFGFDFSQRLFAAVK
ncbi:MAG: glycosyltransferase [Oscillospiraceae bacterium]|nr:glycosyltransferase [Oscillospiraceae bacterium]